jgi:hypothetical protein
MGERGSFNLRGLRRLKIEAPRQGTTAMVAFRDRVRAHAREAEFSGGPKGAGASSSGRGAIANQKMEAIGRLGVGQFGRWWLLFGS